MKNLHYENKNMEVSYEQQTGQVSMATNHFHDTYEIYYLLSGKRSYFIGDSIYQISQGDLVFINMYDLHRTMYAGVPDCERIVINFKTSFIATCDKSTFDEILTPFTTKRRVIRLPVKEQTLAEDIFIKIISEVKNSRTGCDKMMLAYIIQLLVLSARYLEQKPRPDASPPSASDGAAGIVQFINSNFKEHLTLAAVSRHFYISPYYLCKIFKAYTGFTFVEYLNSLRIKEAQRLLRETGYSIAEISEDVGFGSFSHFGRVFKSFSGASPMEYRKSHSKAMYT